MVTDTQRLRELHESRRLLAKERLRCADSALYKITVLLQLLAEERRLIETERLVMGWYVGKCGDCEGSGGTYNSVMEDRPCALCDGSGKIWVDPQGWESEAYIDDED